MRRRHAAMPRAPTNSAPRAEPRAARRDAPRGTARATAARLRRFPNRSRPTIAAAQAVQAAGAGRRRTAVAAAEPGRAGERDEGHAPHARVAARDAGLERLVAPLAHPGGHAQGAGADRHHAGSRQLAGAQDSRRTQLSRRRAALRSPPSRAPCGHRRPLAGEGRRGRLRRSRGRRQDHACSPSSRRAGCCAMARAASPSSRPTPCASAPTNRCTCWDAC